MPLFKVVWHDGLDREYIAERIVEENLPYIEADALCHALRNISRSESDWWKVLQQSARVWGGLEEFV